MTVGAFVLLSKKSLRYFQPILFSRMPESTCLSIENVPETSVKVVFDVVLFNQIPVVSHRRKRAAPWFARSSCRQLFLHRFATHGQLAMNGFNSREIEDEPDDILDVFSLMEHVESDVSLLPQMAEFFSDYSPQQMELIRSAVERQAICRAIRNQAWPVQGRPQQFLSQPQHSKRQDLWNARVATNAWMMRKKYLSN